MKRILVPVDFSSHSVAAARLGLAVAERHGSALTLLHVLDLTLYGAVEPRAWEAYSRDRAETGRKQLAHLAQQLSERSPEVAVDPMTRSGESSETIIAVASDQRADLIVMGSYGADAQRFMMGSVAARVAREACCPVLVTRATQPAPDGAFSHPVVAIDYSKFSLPAARLAATLAAREGTVEMLHIVHWPGRDDADLAGDRTEVLAFERERLRAFVEAGDLAPSRIAARIDTGPAADEILAHVSSSGADLVVAGAHGRDAQAVHLGTVADRLLRGAPVPVLLLPDAAVPPTGGPP